jgi:DNA mismatch repair ATPase MutS
MGKKKAMDHYDRLHALGNIFSGQELEELLTFSMDLPNLDLILPHLEQESLEQYHLRELARFLTTEKKLARLERKLPLENTDEDNSGAMLSILEQHTRDNFSTMDDGGETDKIKQELDCLEENAGKEIRQYEMSIARETGLKMRFPWPRELDPADQRCRTAAQCKNLSCRRSGEMILVDYKPPENLQLLREKKENLISRYEAIMADLLATLNRQIAPFSVSFIHAYHKRKKRILHYLLLKNAENHHLCLPSFHNRYHCVFTAARLPGMERESGNYQPIDITLKKGSSVLFGTNMSGKTTVLKTIYFLLTLVQLGLPLPANSAELRFPSTVDLLLKSAGDIRSGISSFGEELEFFSRKFPDGAYILADELFLSTDPVNGCLLAKLIVESMAKSKKLFLCTSHYPEILKIGKINIYRMADPEPRLVKESRCRDDLKKIMPFRIIPVDRKEREEIENNRTPLETALLFGLPEDVKQAISRMLTGSGNISLALLRTKKTGKQK